MKKKLRSLIRLALPYLITALLPILSVIFLSSFILRGLTEAELSEHRALVERAVKRVDERVSGTEELIHLVAENDAFLQYTIHEISGKGNTLEDCLRIEHILSSVAASSPIADIYYYDAASGRMIGTETVLSDASLFFRYQYQYHDMEPEAALARLHPETCQYGYLDAAHVTINGRSQTVNEYRMIVPIQDFNHYRTHMTVALNSQKLFQDLYDVMNAGAEFYVYRGDDLFFGSGETYLTLSRTPCSPDLQVVEHGDQTVYAMERSLRNGQWTVRFFYPELVVAQNERTAFRVLLPAVLLPILLCVIVCALFTHKNHKEIVEVLALFRGEDSGDDPKNAPDYVSFKLIRTYAGQLVTKNKAYESKLGEMNSSQKVSVLAKLVRNGYRSQEESLAAIRKIDLQVGTGRCAALCVQFDDICNTTFLSEEVTVRDMITRCLTEDTAVNAEVFDNTANEIVCIFSVEDDFDATAEDIIAQLNVQIQYKYGVELRIGVGVPVSSVCAIHRSFEQARSVIRYAARSGAPVRKFSQLDGLEEVCFYPAVTNDKISSYMIAGCAEEAKQVIAEVYRENFQNSTRRLSLDTIVFVQRKIANAVLGVAQLQNIPVSAAALERLSAQNVKKHQSAVMDLVDEIMDGIIMKKKNSQNNLAERIWEYVLGNYADQDLSVREIARHFGFHENYVSNLFKEAYNKNLSTVIEKARIDKACELLASSDIRIEDIAEQVGYASGSSFRRAFKKIMSESPVEYRNSHS